MIGIDKNTKLLLHMDNDIVYDECNNVVINHSVTLDTLRKKFENGSAKFNGKNSYLEIEHTDNFNLARDDFTIDFLIRKDDTSVENYHLLSHFNANFYGWYIAIWDNTINFRTNWNQQILGCPCDLKEGVFYHIALIRYKGILTFYQNGKSIGSVIYNDNIQSVNHNLWIGTGNYSSHKYFNGNMDEIRLTKGVARWTNNFRPPISRYIRCLHLIKKNNQYYSFKSSLYLLGQPKINQELEKWYKENGIDDLNTLIEENNGKSVNLKLDKNDTYKTTTLIDFNEITNDIKYIEKNNKKEIEYNVKEYQLLDLVKEKIGSKFQIAKWEEGDNIE